MKQRIFEDIHIDGKNTDNITLVYDSDDRIRRVKRVKQHIRKSDVNIWMYVGLLGQVGYTVAIPIAGGAILGSAVDKKMLTYPKATLSFLFIGIVISFIGFIRTIADAFIHKK